LYITQLTGRHRHAKDNDHRGTAKYGNHHAGADTAGDSADGVLPSADDEVTRCSERVDGIPRRYRLDVEVICHDEGVGRIPRTCTQEWGLGKRRS